MKKKSRRISGQKIFNFLSCLFLLTCVIIYGYRFINLYIENNKTNSDDVTNLAKKVKIDNNNNDSFKNIKSDYYFNGSEINNYVTYANLTWRIIKIANNNNTTLILDEPITSLAYSSDVSTYMDSTINEWLTDENIFKSIIDNNDFLVANNNCTEKISNIKNITCDTIDQESHISILTLEDYANTGNTKSFINNGFSVYFANPKDSGKAWYLTDTGTIKESDGTDIYGIKPVITLNSTVEITEGNGTKEEPYHINTNTKYFANYVKLNNDLWRIYQEDNTYVKLVSTDYLKNNNKQAELPYSATNSYHNDSIQGSIAYYLNHNYLNKLSYKQNIDEIKWSNGYYSDTTKFDYNDSLDPTINTKVATLSIGDVNLVPSLDNYFLMTGLNKKGNSVYLYNKNGEVTTTKATTKANVIPTISIKKELLTKGTGSKEEPYEMED